MSPYSAVNKKKKKQQLKNRNGKWNLNRTQMHKRLKDEKTDEDNQRMATQQQQQQQKSVLN